MVVSGTVLAQELRRRKVGRRTMVDSLDTANRSTWLPGEPRAVPTSMLVLAALSLSRPLPRP